MIVTVRAPRQFSIVSLEPEGTSMRTIRDESRPPLITLTDAPDARAKAIIHEGLGRYNQEKAGYRDSHPLAVLISEPTHNKVVGGLLGRTSLGLFFIDVLFVPESLRGHRVGSLILDRAERGARKRGCTAATLYTIAFQAPGIYERHGYSVLVKIEC